MNNPYAASKYSAELEIRLSGLEYVIFRYFNLAGADPENEMGECHEPETHLIPRILQNLNNFTIYGNDYETPDGTCVRDYVHVSDVADAHVLAAEHLVNGKKSQILNLGTGRGYSVQDIVNLVKKVTGQDVTFRYDSRRAGDPPFLFADVSLAEKVLTYRPKHDIISIIQTAYNWHTRHDNT
jgi:UDP-glucose 4-epimerase